MLRVLLYNTPNSLNYGSMMMAENAMYYLTKQLAPRRVEYLIVTPKPEETIDRFEKALGGKTSYVKLTPVHPQCVVTGSELGRVASELSGIGFRRRLATSLKDVAGVVVLGGDDFTEDYGYRGAIRVLVTLRAFAKAGLRVVMLGQSVGPFYSWREPLVRWLLQSVSAIVAREPITYKYLLREMRLGTVSLGADLAFLPLACEDQVEYPKPTERYWVLVPSEILWRYSGEADRRAYIHTLRRICLNVAQRLPDDDLVILPHVVTGKWDDDRKAAEDLYQSLNLERRLRNRVHYISDVLLPWQARCVLGNARVVITGRMHAAISTLVRGRPVVSLAYSRKYHGILGEYLGLKKYVLDVRQLTWAAIEDETVRATMDVIEKWPAMHPWVVDNVTRMQCKAEEAIRGVAELLSASPGRATHTA